MTLETELITLLWDGLPRTWPWRRWSLMTFSLSPPRGWIWVFVEVLLWIDMKCIADLCGPLMDPLTFPVVPLLLLRFWLKCLNNWWMCSLQFGSDLCGLSELLFWTFHQAPNFQYVQYCYYLEVCFSFQWLLQPDRVVDSFLSTRCADHLHLAEIWWQFEPPVSVCRCGLAEQITFYSKPVYVSVVCVQIDDQVWFAQEHQLQTEFQSRVLTSLAKEKGMTSVATSMSADARDTRKRFWGALRARLVNTATTTSTLPITVPKMMTVTTSTMNTDATCEWGGRGGDLGEEEELWLMISKEEFGGRVAGMVAITDVDTYE